MDFKQTMENAVKNYGGGGNLNQILSIARQKIAENPQGFRKMISDPTKVAAMLSLLPPEQRPRALEILSNPDKLENALNDGTFEEILKSIK